MSLLPPRPVKAAPSDKKTEGFYGPRPLWRELLRVARENGWNRSELVVGVLTEWLERYKAAKAAESKRSH